jgi:hypothetical protein
VDRSNNELSDFFSALWALQCPRQQSSVRRPRDNVPMLFLITKSVVTPGTNSAVRHKLCERRQRDKLVLDDSWKLKFLTLYELLLSV